MIEDTPLLKCFQMDSRPSGYSSVGRQRYIISNKKDANVVLLLKAKAYDNLVSPCIYFFSCVEKCTFHLVLFALYFTRGKLDFLYKVRQLHLL